MAGYRPRIADGMLEFRLESFGAVLLTGPKGCGKTTTAKQRAASSIELQDEDSREGYLATAAVKPSLLLEGANPRLIDEWQDAPKIWGAVRKSVDDRGENGLYILTGSTSKTVETPHTGTGRISRMRMLPMSLHESGESNGTVSIGALFDDPDGYEGCASSLTVEQLVFAVCRGGWPRAVGNATDRSKLAVAKDLFAQTCEVDASNIDGVSRNPRWVRAVAKAHARSVCSPADKKTVYGDARAATQMSEPTYDDYVSALERLFVLDDVPAWRPAIRSKTAIRSKPKRNFVDPSIAAAALGVSPSYFNTDFKTLGFLFESLCIRDLKAYSAPLGGEVSYYRDRYGLEADCVLHLEDGRYALIEVKLGESEAEAAASHLLHIERLVSEANAKSPQCPIRPPDLKIVLTGTQYGYRRPDGVLVVPVGCLRD